MERCSDCGLQNTPTLEALYGPGWFPYHLHPKAPPKEERLKYIYPTCPFCGHASYHKTVACDDTCCGGCPEEDDEGIICDCQKTESQIKEANDHSQHS